MMCLIKRTQQRRGWNSYGGTLVTRRAVTERDRREEGQRHTERRDKRGREGSRGGKGSLCPSRGKTGAEGEMT